MKVAPEATGRQSFGLPVSGAIAQASGSAEVGTSASPVEHTPVATSQLPAPPPTH